GQGEKVFLVVIGAVRLLFDFRENDEATPHSDRPDVDLAWPRGGSGACARAQREPVAAVYHLWSQYSLARSDLRIGRDDEGQSARSHSTAGSLDDARDRQPAVTADNSAGVTARGAAF